MYNDSIKDIYSVFLKANDVSIDSRTIKENDIFFAIKGGNFDGNKFAKKALDQGALVAIVDDKSLSNENDSFILVDDVLKTLQNLAAYHRAQFQIPVVAITGSNGKTTTKELIAAILKTTYQVHFTKGNFNNHIGVPLTLLSMPISTEIAVIELGANHSNEIEFLCDIAQPTHGIITNIGKAHLEGFGDLNGVKKAKGELFDYIKETNGYVFVNEGDEIVKQLAKNLQTISYKAVDNFTDDDFLYQYELLQVSPHIECRFLNFEKESCLVTSSLFGDYNFQNIMAAITIGRYFKVLDKKIVSAIEKYVPQNNRSQIIELNSNTIYLDAYNANPSSMIAALNNFSKLKSTCKIVILGDMLELGAYAENEHQRIYDFAEGQHFDLIVLVGKEFKKLNTSLHFNNVSELKQWWKKQKYLNCSILLKGSRGIQLEQFL